MLIAALICMVVAAVALYICLRQRRTLTAARSTQTLTCGEISELSKATPPGAAGAPFSRACEIVGVAAASEPAGQTAPESKVQCVWHKTTVTEHYYDWERDSDGDRRRVRRERTLSTHVSEIPFTVDDGTGTVVIDPRGAELDGEEKVLDEMRQREGSGGLEGRVAKLGAGLIGADSPLGLQYQEWVIRTGTQVYVLGEARAASGQIVLTKPEKGPMIISTRSEEEFTRVARRTVLLAGLVAGAFGVLGLGLLTSAVIG